MAPMAALLLATAAATAVPAPGSGEAPHSRASAMATVSVVIVEGGRASEEPTSERLQRQIRRQDGVILVEFN